jgi:hypothetical protein
MCLRDRDLKGQQREMVFWPIFCLGNVSDLGSESKKVKVSVNNGKTFKKIYGPLFLS